MTLTQPPPQCGAAAAAQARNYGEPCVFLGSGRLHAHGGPDPAPGDEAGRRGGAASPAGAGSLFTLFLASPALALAHLLGLPDASARCAPAVAAAPPPGSLTLTARISSSPWPMLVLGRERLHHFFYIVTINGRSMMTMMAGVCAVCWRRSRRRWTRCWRTGAGCSGRTWSWRRRGRGCWTTRSSAPSRCASSSPAPSSPTSARRRLPPPRRPPPAPPPPPPRPRSR